MTRSWKIAMLIAAAATGASAQNNSLYHRAEQEDAVRSQRGRAVGAAQDTAGSSEGGETLPSTRTGSTSVSKASWVAVDKPRPKDIRVHDLVTIVIHEASKHSTKADNESEREYAIDLALKDWMKFTHGNLTPDPQTNGDPRIGFDFSKEFEGKGEVEREDLLTARIQAEVIDVLPNGNLVLEAMHSVITDEEETTITLTGVCRSKDVGADNTILSTQLARLDVQKHHRGTARDATKPGLLGGLLDWLTLF